MAVRLTLDTSVKYIKGIGDARAAAFSRLGIETVGDLLTFYPRTYEERGRIVKIADAKNRAKQIAPTILNFSRSFITLKPF